MLSTPAGSTGLPLAGQVSSPLPPQWATRSSQAYFVVPCRQPMIAGERIVSGSSVSELIALRALTSHHWFRGTGKMQVREDYRSARPIASPIMSGCMPCTIVMIVLRCSSNICVLISTLLYACRSLKHTECPLDKGWNEMDARRHHRAGSVRKGVSGGRTYYAHYPETRYGNAVMTWYYSKVAGSD